jgi:hypothetical protein
MATVGKQLRFMVFHGGLIDGLQNVTRPIEKDSVERGRELVTNWDISIAQIFTNIIAHDL